MIPRTADRLGPNTGGSITDMVHEQDRDDITDQDLEISTQPTGTMAGTRLANTLEKGKEHAIIEPSNEPEPTMN
jgi:hypothetical protein